MNNDYEILERKLNLIIKNQNSSKMRQRVIITLLMVLIGIIITLYLWWMQ